MDSNIIFLIHPNLSTVKCIETQDCLSNILFSCFESDIPGYSISFSSPAKIQLKLYILDITNSFLALFKERISKTKNGFLNRLYHDFFSKITGSKCLLVYTNDYFESLTNIKSNFFLEVFKCLHGNLNKHADFSKALEESINQANELMKPFGNLFNNYDMVTNKTKEKVGKSNKNERVCRFCGRTIKTGAKFTNKAHIIPEAFGNKNFICYEECDECNHYFGNKIEPYLIQLYDMQRMFFEVNSKKPSLTFKYPNGITVTNNPKYKNYSNTNSIPNTNFDIIINKSSQTFTLNNPTIRMEHNEIIFQNAYKSIIKMALNFIPEKYLEYFKNTKQWLLNSNSKCNLPKVFIINKISQLEASITLFIRTSENVNLPFLLVLFSYGNKSYLAIAPYCSKDTKLFLNDEDFEIIKNEFKFFLSDNYQLVDFSSIEPQKLYTNLNFSLKNKSDSNI